jgi:hypothetical protein
MTTAGRWRQRRRPLLLFGFGLSLAWALYWLWPPNQPKPDFVIEISSTDVIEFRDYPGSARPPLPYYKDGRFFSADGRAIDPKDVIRDERNPSNVDYYHFTASFFLDDAATQGDFKAAARQIWAVCSVPLFIASRGQKDSPAVLPVGQFKDCAPAFADRSTHSL